MMPDAARIRGQPPLPALDEGIAGADVVMMLRIQHERAARRAGGCRGLSPRVRADGRAPRSRGAGSDRHAPRPDEPRRRDRAGRRRRPAVRDSPPGRERRRRAHGRARARSPECARPRDARREPRPPRIAAPSSSRTPPSSTTSAFDGGQFVMRLAAPRCAAAATPGSFIHLTCGPDLPMRRPLSIMRANRAEGWVEVLYKVVGHGLAELALRDGRAIRLLPWADRHAASRPHPARPRTASRGRRRRHPADGVLRGVARRGARPPALRADGLGATFPFRPRRVAAAAPGLPAGATPAMPLLENLRRAQPPREPSGFAGCHRRLRHGTRRRLARFARRG